MLKSRNPILVAGLIVVLLGSAGIAYVLRPTAAPSGELEAVPIEITTQTPTQFVASPESEAMPTEAAPTEEPVASLGGVYEIQQNGSRASFTLDEVLRGQDTTVVGSTNQVAGQIFIDAENPQASQLGLIQINARTLQTDVENRNRTIRNEILDVDDYEFISFEATALEGLPESVAIGESYNFDIVGDLTIRDVTRQVRFATTLMIDSAERISGSASTTVRYADFGLIIPSVPFVASVEPEVLLSIDFVASAQ